LSVRFLSVLILRRVISDEIGFREPSAEEMPQEIDNDRNESREER